MGTEHLKLTIVFLVGLVTSTMDALDDKKIKFFEALGLGLKLKDLPEIIENVDKIKDELKDLDEAERRELIDFISAKFELDNQKAELAIEFAISTISSFYVFHLQMRALKA